MLKCPSVECIPDGNASWKAMKEWQDNACFTRVNMFIRMIHSTVMKKRKIDSEVGEQNYREMYVLNMRRSVAETLKIMLN